MNDTQLYFAIGVPALFALPGIAVNIVLYVHLSSVMNSRFEAMEHRFEVLTGKVVDIDNCLTRIEERLSARA